MKADALEEYRKSWTTDTDASRKMRFETESRRAGNASAPRKFTVSSLRSLPGTPIGFERLRQSLVDHYGLLAIPFLRNACHSRSMLSFTCVNQILKQLEITVSRVEMTQVRKYACRTN